MQKKKDELVKSDVDTLRELFSQYQILYETIKNNGGIIPEGFDETEKAIADKIDDYGFVKMLYEREIEQIEADIRPFEKIANIGKEKIKKLQDGLDSFKKYTCGLIEAFGEPGGSDGKKRITGNYFWIKSLKREKRKLKDKSLIPDEHKLVLVAIPMSDYKDFYSHLGKVDEIVDETSLPAEYYDVEVLENSQFYENTKKEISNGKQLN